MTQETLDILGYLPFFMALFWLVLCHILFKILQANHPEQYARMGEPRLFSQKSSRPFLHFMKFLFKLEFNSLNDGTVKFLGWFMLAYIVIFLLLFVYLVATTMHLHV